MLFIYGPKYSRSKLQVHVLLDFIFRQTKLAIWLSRKRKLLGLELTDVILVFRGLIKSHINIEYAYYKMSDDLDSFRSKWGINQCVCEIMMVVCKFLSD